MHYTRSRHHQRPASAAIVLVPLTQKTFDALIPAVPTSDQYHYYWGSGQDLFRRLLISAAAAIVFSLLYGRVTADNNISFNLWAALLFVCAGLGGLYWLLGPVVQAARRNAKLRRYDYCAFWQAEVVDTYLSQEVLSSKESYDPRGRLEVVHDTTSFCNLELSDREGFSLTARLPMRREYKRIAVGDRVCLLLFSNEPQFRRVGRAITDLYFPDLNLWASDYPYLRRDAFRDVTHYLLSRRSAAVVDEYVA